MRSPESTLSSHGSKSEDLSSLVNEPVPDDISSIFDNPLNEIDPSPVKASNNEKYDTRLTGLDRYPKSRIALSAARIEAIFRKLSGDAQPEARAAEKSNMGERTIIKIGRSALRDPKMGLYGMGMDVLKVGLVGEGGGGTADHDSRVIAAHNETTELLAYARQEVAKRYEHRLNEYHRVKNQNQAFASYAPNIEFTQNRVSEQTKADRLDNAKQDTRVRSKASELHAQIKGGAKRLGRAALKVFKRSNAAITKT